MNNSLPVLAEVRRGTLVEGRHRGSIVVVEPEGRIFAELGNSELITSTRSTIKPIQCIPVITSGAADRFRMTEAEIALCCASHQGEPIHTEAVAQILERIGLDETALMCGPQAPSSDDVARELVREGKPATQLHNNCSGKHAGMLATAVHRGLPIKDYVNVNHPLQRAIIEALSRLADLESHLPTAIDGCSAPTFGVPLRSLALAFSRLVDPVFLERLDPDIAKAAARIVEVMIANPEMVGGSKGRFDTDLLRASGGKLICKVGAEAVYSVGVLPCDRYPRGLGIAVKIEDGNYRGMGPAVVETLAQLEVLDESELAKLAPYHRTKIDNRRGLIVGEVVTTFTLPR